MKNKVLIIAFFYPPSSNASVQRILKLTEYLPGLGWEPIVLTAKPFAYAGRLESSQGIPPSIQSCVYRLPAVDVSKHLSVKGKYLGCLELVDRWSSWIPGAIIKGMKLVGSFRPDIILSTTPIPSANIIAYYLSRKSKIPWIADYQDPFRYHYRKIELFKGIVQKKIDKMTVSNCKKAIFATENAKEAYIECFGEMFRDKFLTIENGYDEVNWLKIQDVTSLESGFSFDVDKFTILYSGALYSNGRDPLPVFKAISFLSGEGIINEKNFELVFQGAGTGEKFQEVLEGLSINSLVRFTGSVPYLESLCSMQRANALLLIQDAIFNLQTPGKLYEYIRAGRPIVVVTPHESSTGNAARRYQLASVGQSTEDIILILKQLIESSGHVTEEVRTQDFSRYARAIDYAGIFNKCKLENV